MTKVFDETKRSFELMQQGVPDDEAMKILDKEFEEADEIVINDGLWWDTMKQSIDAGIEDAKKRLGEVNSEKS